MAAMAELWGLNPTPPTCHTASRCSDSYYLVTINGMNSFGDKESLGPGKD